MDRGRVVINSLIFSIRILGSSTPRKRKKVIKIQLKEKLKCKKQFNTVQISMILFGNQSYENNL